MVVDSALVLYSQTVSAVLQAEDGYADVSNSVQIGNYHGLYVQEACSKLYVGFPTFKIFSYF